MLEAKPNNKSVYLYAGLNIEKANQNLDRNYLAFVIKESEKFFGIYEGALEKNTHEKSNVRISQIRYYAIVIIRRNTKLGVKEIGRLFGSRHHSITNAASAKIIEIENESTKIFQKELKEFNDLQTYLKEKWKKQNQ